jgi:hypothetical protein
MTTVGAQAWGWDSVDSWPPRHSQKQQGDADRYTIKESQREWGMDDTVVSHKLTQSKYIQGPGQLRV